MGTQNNELNDGLTDEERAALAEDDGADAEAETNQNEEENAEAAAANSDEGDGDAGAGDDAPAPAGDENADSAPGRDDGQPAEPASEQQEGTQSQSAPILVAEAPADAEARLAEISNGKAELLTKFDDGEIAAKEYQAELDKFAKQEREIERAIDKANLAAEMEQQRQRNEWFSSVNRFIEANPLYKPESNPRLYRALDAEVRDLANRPEAASWSGDRILQEAHKNLSEAFGLGKPAAQPAAQPEKKAVPKPQLPPTLAKVPAAEQSDTGEGKWAALDRMATADPLGYEEALTKMSDSERNAYLAA